MARGRVHGPQRMIAAPDCLHAVEQAAEAGDDGRFYVLEEA